MWTHWPTYPSSPPPAVPSFDVYEINGYFGYFAHGPPNPVATILYSGSAPHYTVSVSPGTTPALGGQWAGPVNAIAHVSVRNGFGGPPPPPMFLYSAEFDVVYQSYGADAYLRRALEVVDSGSVIRQQWPLLPWPRLPGTQYTFQSTGSLNFERPLAPGWKFRLPSLPDVAGVVDKIQWSAEPLGALVP